MMSSEEQQTRRQLAKRLAATVTSCCMAWSVRRGPRPSSKAALVERPPSGAEIWQVTVERQWHSNIYCEVPYCSGDSRYFVYARSSDDRLNRTEFVAVELGVWKEHRLDTAATMSGCAVSPDGIFYYVKRGDGGELRLMRADIAEGSPNEVFRFPAGFGARSLGTVTSTHRWYGVGTMSQPGWKMFDIAVVDLRASKLMIIDRDPYILNPHPQFDPGNESRMLVQHNRGGRFSADGKLEQLVGPEGATLYLLSVPDGKRTELPVGKPYTTPCTGHEAWIGGSGEVLFSVSASGEYRAEKGNLLGVRPDGTVRRVARGYRFNHVGVSRCGRLFSADDWQGSFKLVIGSIRTGRTAVACESKTKPTRSQNTHPHPYLTPDLKWLIFNSNRTGWPHIYAARLPDEMVQELLA